MLTTFDNLSQECWHSFMKTISKHMFSDIFNVIIHPFDIIVWNRLKSIQLNAIDHSDGWMGDPFFGLFVFFGKEIRFHNTCLWVLHAVPVVFGSCRIISYILEIIVFHLTKIIPSLIYWRTIFKDFYTFLWLTWRTTWTEFNTFLLFNFWW